MNNLLEYAAIDYTIHFPAIDSSITLTNEQRRNIILATKEIVHNAVKYSGKANPKAMIGKIMGEFPDAKKDMRTTVETINKIDLHANKLNIGERKEHEILTYQLLTFEKALDNAIVLLLSPMDHSMSSIVIWQGCSYPQAWVISAISFTKV